MGASRKYPDELRERATRMALEALDDPDRSRGAIVRVAEQLGVHREALRTWVRKAQAEGQDGSSVSTDRDSRLAELEKENRELAANIKALQQQRQTIAEQVEGMLDEFPLAEVLISMPGVGIKTASNILLAVGDCSDFASASHLAAYAGIAPVARRSGTSIKGEFPARSGNKRLKNAMFRSAWITSNCHGPSRAYYQRKRAEGKKHNAAVMCLARHRSNVIYAMLTNREFFREPPVTPEVPAAA